MKSIIYVKASKVNWGNVPNISRRGFSKLPLVFGKTSVEVNTQRMHGTRLTPGKWPQGSLALSTGRRLLLGNRGLSLTLDMPGSEPPALRVC